eukprot:TRINITY_DN6013_c0_g1_i1.p1 TRINITY_DN6013_c0_g1~~TRINITY_DN6013_c0_g1_i1.p1  ORF type:complete len:636 (+),score=127.49 TRINITY_DN6013_c0_g1_i1:55-1908(+)
MDSHKLTSENFVEYHIYLPPSLSSSSLLLQTEATILLSSISKFTSDYIWQKEPFSLRIHTSPTSTSSSVPSHLWNRTYFGDNIDDEWFIVFLLYEISKKYTETIISVFDNDGEFLLIESALYLPRWIKPETSKNRVYLKNGELHVIPLPLSPSELLSSPISLEISAALKILRDPSRSSKLSDEVQNAIYKRTHRSPDDFNSSFHWSRCFLPVSIAYLLQERPNLIAPATVAFYERDFDGQKALNLMKKFKPQMSQQLKVEEGEIPGEGWVSTLVKFTKCLFAQLEQQPFHPPKALGVRLPSPTHPDYKPFLRGIKLTCGFEIIYFLKGISKWQKKIPPTHDFEGDGNWDLYRKLILEKERNEGIVPGLVENSCLKIYYLRTLNKEYDRYYTLPELYFTKECIDSTLKDLDENKGSLKKLERTEDNEDWLSISPTNLDSILREYSDANFKENVQPTKTKPDLKDNSQPMEHLENMIGGMHRFINNVSEMDGADFPSIQNSHLTEYNDDEILNVLQKSLDQDESSEEEGFYDAGETDEEDIEGQTDSFRGLMREMDVELNSTSVGKSFKSNQEPKADSTEDYGPIDMDFNLVQNILESFSAQEGAPGPYSNLFGALKDK